MFAASYLTFSTYFSTRKYLLVDCTAIIKTPLVGGVRGRKRGKAAADKFLERLRSLKWHSVFEKRRQRIAGPVYSSAVAWTLKFVGEADGKSSVSNRPPVASRLCSSLVLAPIETFVSLSCSFLSFLLFTPKRRSRSLVHKYQNIWGKHGKHDSKASSSLMNSFEWIL